MVANSPAPGTPQTAHKSFAGVATGVITTLADAVAAGVLHGTAETVAQVIITVAGLFGIGGAVYRTNNRVKL